jgi:zinc protease
VKAAQLVSARRPPLVELPIQRFDLRCGALLLVSPRPAAPVTAVHVHLRGGHSLDPAGREGTAFLVGGLLDQGTAAHTEEELAEVLESAGGTLSGDAHGLSGSIASDSWKTLLELAAEVITTPTYPTEKLRLQQKRLLDRLLIERDEPRVQAELSFRKLVYGDHWLGRPSHGSIESVQRIDRRHVIAHHKANWVARRALIAVCGDVEPEQVRRLLDRRLADWKPGQQLAPRNDVFPEPGVRVDAFEAEREQVHLYLGHLGVRRLDPDYPALVVMDHILGTGPGFTNRISMRLRDELGLAYTVQAAIHPSAGIQPGTFTAYIGTSPQHVPTALEGFRREILRIQRELVTKDELRTAVDYVVGSFAMSFQRSSRRANYLISVQRHGLPDDNLERLQRDFAAVTVDDVRRVAQRHLLPDQSAVCAGGPVKARELARTMKKLTGRRGR